MSDHTVLPADWALGCARDAARAADRHQHDRWRPKSYRAWLYEGTLYTTVRLEPWGTCLGLASWDVDDLVAADYADARSLLKAWFSNPAEDRSVLPPISTPLADDMARRFPRLWRFLTATSGPNGEARKPGTLSMCIGQAAWTVWLNDRQTGYMLWLTCGSMAEAYEVCEAALNDDQPQWRKNRYVHGDSGRANPKSP